MATKSRKPKRSKVKMAKPKTSKPRTTTSSTGTRTTTRSRRGKAKGGLRKVTRSKSSTLPSLSGPGGSATKRKATVKTKGGLKRTAKVSKTTTGSGAGRVSKTRRVVTRVKNGRTVKRVVTRINRGGKVTVKKSAPQVSGKGPASTRPTHHPIATTKVKNPGVKHSPVLGGNAAHQARNGGTTAPAKRRKRK